VDHGPRRFFFFAVVVYAAMTESDVTGRAKNDQIPYWIFS
jgi:hypothetical protein